MIRNPKHEIRNKLESENLIIKKQNDNVKFKNENAAKRAMWRDKNYAALSGRGARGWGWDPGRSPGLF
jgi:hypothetical protein